MLSRYFLSGEKINYQEKHYPQNQHGNARPHPFLAGAEQEEPDDESHHYEYDGYHQRPVAWDDADAVKRGEYQKQDRHNDGRFVGHDLYIVALLIKI